MPGHTNTLKKTYLEIYPGLQLVFANTGVATYTFLSGTMKKDFNNRFILASSPLSNEPMLMIVDYMWWSESEKQIHAWMNENLPRGSNHQQGMMLLFDSEKDRTWFLLRWQ